MSDTKVSGIFTIRNALDAGYPFLESLLSVYPMVDEFLINDGGSDDGTLELMERLEQNYSKFELYEIEDFESEHWEVIDYQLEELIDEADGDWIFEAQGDEIWPEYSVDTVNELISFIDDTMYNSIRNKRIKVDEGRVIGSPYWTVRIVRNSDGLSSWEGGDSFSMSDTHKGGFLTNTSHHCPPELTVDIPIFHLVSGTDEQRVERFRRHAEHLATESDTRREIYERVKYLSDE